MSDTASEFADELRHDLHGEQVNRLNSFVCDRCDTEISTEEPVMYEALRIVDMPNLEMVVDSPDEWVLDAARCRDCEIENLEPATDGFDEALILLSITESNGILSADTSEMTVADVSSDGEGYYPPLVNPILLSEANDPGYARWTRLEGFLNSSESDDHSEKMTKLIREAVRRSKEVPPSINL